MVNLLKQLINFNYWFLQKLISENNIFSIFLYYIYLYISWNLETWFIGKMKFKQNGKDEEHFLASNLIPQIHEFVTINQLMTYTWVYISFLYLYYNWWCEKTQKIQFVNRKYYTNWYLVKRNSIKKEKTKNISTAWRKSTSTAKCSQKKKWQSYLSWYVMIGFMYWINTK